MVWRLDFALVRRVAFGLATSRDHLLNFWRVFVPNIASAKKNMRKSRAATVRNRAQRSALRTALKKAKAPTRDRAEERTAAVSLLDRAARKGLIHKNAAARQQEPAGEGRRDRLTSVAGTMQKRAGRTTSSTGVVFVALTAALRATPAPRRSARSTTRWDSSSCRTRGT